MEDVLRKIAEASYALPTRDRKFVNSVARRAEQGTALTTRQGWAFVNVLRNNPEIHREIGMKKDALSALVAQPQWRQPLVPSVELRPEVRYIGDNMVGFRGSTSKMEVEFAAMKAVYSDGMNIVTITNRAQLDSVISTIGKWSFAMDVPTEHFLANCMEHHEAIPRAIVEGDNLLLDVPNANVLAQFLLHVVGADIL